MQQELLTELETLIKGDVDSSTDTLTTYSHDASLFEIRPQVVIFPKNSEDIKAVVSFVNKHKQAHPELSIVARSAGTCMSGGSIGSSIILDFTRYMNKIKTLDQERVVIEPGCFYRDLEKATLKINRIMPAYTASKELCAVGGMVGNNSGGEKTIRYGKVENYIQKLKIIFTDGNEYTIVPLSPSELEAKIALNTFESEIYKKIKTLLEHNHQDITEAKPIVSKNSAGYYLWNIQQDNKFDLNRLIVGSQGTLGIVTEITFGLVPSPQYSNLLAVFMPDISHLSEIVNEILPFKPDSLESYDDYSMKLALKFIFDFWKRLGTWGLIKLGFKFIPEALMTLTGGVPKLILLVEFGGLNHDEVYNKLLAVKEKIKHFGYKMHIAKNEAEAEKYWLTRRESFNMLRKHVKGKRTAPFIDDIIVKPEYLPEFLPKLQNLLNQYKLVYTIAGHAGNGNFHIIPLMDMKDPESREIIFDLSTKVYNLVHEYKGSITAEHNDGIIRTPYLAHMFPPRIIELFKQTKNIFDPDNILNPGKKVGGTLEDIRKYIKKTN